MFIMHIFYLVHFPRNLQYHFKNYSKEKDRMEEIVV